MTPLWYTAINLMHGYCILCIVRGQSLIVGCVYVYKYVGVHRSINFWE